MAVNHFQTVHLIGNGNERQRKNIRSTQFSRARFYSLSSRKKGNTKYFTFFPFFQPFSFFILVFKYITHENEQAFNANIEKIESKQVDYM